MLNGISQAGQGCVYLVTSETQAQRRKSMIKSAGSCFTKREYRKIVRAQNDAFLLLSRSHPSEHMSPVHVLIVRSVMRERGLIYD